MKDTDKVSLTLGQLKKLIQESKQINEGSIYMDCHIYRDGNYWIIYDEIYNTVVTKISDYDFMHNDKINTFEIIRKWRETHPENKNDEIAESTWPPKYFTVKELISLLKKQPADSIIVFKTSDGVDAWRPESVDVYYDGNYGDTTWTAIEIPYNSHERGEGVSRLLN